MVPRHKPDPVLRDHPSWIRVTTNLKRPYPKLRSGTPLAPAKDGMQRFLFGLSPSGVYLANLISETSGGFRFENFLQVVGMLIVDANANRSTSEDCIL